MTFNPHFLISLFPVAFLLHDLEELLWFEPWMKKNATDIQDRLKDKVPAFFEREAHMTGPTSL